MAPCLGLLTGVSYQSGLDYYKNVNEKYMQLVPKGHLMPPNPLMVMVSVDCDVYAKMLAIDKDWDGVAEYISHGVGRLVKAEVGNPHTVQSPRSALTGHCACYRSTFSSSAPTRRIWPCQGSASSTQGCQSCTLPTRLRAPSRQRV